MDRSFVYRFSWHDLVVGLDMALGEKRVSVASEFLSFSEDDDSINRKRK